MSIREFLLVYWASELEEILAIVFFLAGYETAGLLLALLSIKSLLSTAIRTTNQK